jgi:hypothetical protein
VLRGPLELSLAAGIGVMDQPVEGLVAAVPQDVLKRHERQLDAQVGRILR